MDKNTALNIFPEITAPPADSSDDDADIPALHNANFQAYLLSMSDKNTCLLQESQQKYAAAGHAAQKIQHQIDNTTQRLQTVEIRNITYRALLEVRTEEVLQLLALRDAHVVTDRIWTALENHQAAALEKTTLSAAHDATLLHLAQQVWNPPALHQLITDATKLAREKHFTSAAAIEEVLGEIINQFHQAYAGASRAPNCKESRELVETKIIGAISLYHDAEQQIISNDNAWHNADRYLQTLISRQKKCSAEKELLTDIILKAESIASFTLDLLVDMIPWLEMGGPAPAEAGSVPAQALSAHIGQLTPLVGDLHNELEQLRDRLEAMDSIDHAEDEGYVAVDSSDGELSSNGSVASDDDEESMTGPYGLADEEDTGVQFLLAKAYPAQDADAPHATVESLEAQTADCAVYFP